jgi:hypothetical protein
MRGAALVRGRTVALEENEADSRILVWRCTSGARALQGAAVNGRRCEEQRRQVAAAGWLASNLLRVHRLSPNGRQGGKLAREPHSLRGRIMVGRLSLDVRQMFGRIMAPRRIGGPPTAAESLRPMRVVRLRTEGRLNGAASWIASRNGAALVRGASLMRRPRALDSALSRRERR